VLWVVVTLLFLLFRLAPGNPLVAYIDPTFTKEQQDQLLRQFGLDKPLYVQYFFYLGNLLRGEFGASFFQRQPVDEIVLEVLPNTLYLTLTSLFLAYIIGVIGGIILAWQRGTRLEQMGVTFTLMTRAAPDFWVGMIFLAVFAFGLRWFPSSGATSPGTIYETEWAKLTSFDFWWHLALPAMTLAIYLHGLPLLLMRSNMLEVLQDDFITMGRLMGYSEWRVMVRHAARNALLPVVTAMALGVGYSIGGNVVIENVFGWPGLGRTLVRAVSASDFPLAQGAFLFIAVVMVAMNFIADFLYGVLDPRVGSSERAKA
jgi:peptide/nickel transport system permease protein